MGCFDTVRIPCPKCGDFYSEQTKAGFCGLITYGIYDAPVKLLADIEPETFKCATCGTHFKLKLQVNAQVIYADVDEDDEEDYPDYTPQRKRG